VATARAVSGVIAVRVVRATKLKLRMGSKTNG